MIEAVVKVNKDLIATMKAIRKELRDVTTTGGAYAKALVGQAGRFDADQNKVVFKHTFAPSGAKWKPLTPAYKKRKRVLRRQLGFGSLGKTLQLSGGLRKSLVQRGEDRIVRTKSGVLELGTKHRLAAVHQTGNPSGNLPARTMVGKTRNQRRHIRAKLALIAFTRFARVAKTQHVKDSFLAQLQKLRPNPRKF